MRVVPIFCNESRCVTYIIYSDVGNECIVIDPGQSADLINAVLNKHNRICTAVLLTHGHYDHIEGLDELIKTTGAPTYIHVNDIKMPSDSFLNVSAQFNDKPVKSNIIDFINVSDGDVFSIAGLTFRVIHTPGHTPGSTSYLFDDGDKKVLFSGDTLFSQSIGRFDLPGGDRIVLLKSLSRLVDELSDDTLVYPGHGPRTSIGVEKKHNFFLQMG